MIGLLKDIILTDLGMRLGWDRLLRPVILHLTTTNRCNMRCQMCNIWKLRPHQDLPDAALRNLARSPLARGLRVLDVTGGEPFLVDVERIIELSGGRRFRTILFSSNGTLTEKTVETVGRLLKTYPRSTLVVDISLDGLEAQHDRIRGVPGTFARASATLKALAETARENHRLKPTAKFTIMRDNYRELLPVYEFARGLGAEFTTKPASEFGFTDNIGDKSYVFTPEETAEIVSALARIVESQKTSPLLRDTFMHRIYRQAEIIFHTELIGYMRRTFIEGRKVQAGRCYSSSISILAHFDGKIYNCPTLLKPMGDLTAQPLEEIWRGETMRRMRKFIASGSCSCYSQCDLMPALVLGHKRELLAGLFRRYGV